MPDLFAVIKSLLTCSLLTLNFFTGALFAQDDSRGINAPDFFPIAVWAQDPAQAAEYKKAGINMYIHIHNGLDEEKLRQLREADMKVIAHQNSFGLSRLDDPLIYGWMHGDEPDNAQRNKKENRWDPCLDPADIIRAYKAIKKNDPSRPVYLNVGPGAAYTDWVGRGACRGRTDMYMVANNGYLKGCDVASFDIYPVNSAEQDVRGRLWYVAEGITNLKKWSNDSKPVWCWIETTRISEKSRRKPTPAEVRAEVWMAIIHGAKGFGYFCHSFVEPTDDAALLHDPDMLDAVTKINAEVTGLARVLNSPDLPEYASVKTHNEDVPIKLLAKRQGDEHYVFAVAMRNKETTATFRVKRGRKVEVIGEGRTLEVRNKRFTDTFQGYGVRLYKITR